MIDKKLSALLGSLLLLAAAMPMATAHLSNTGSFTSGVHTATPAGGTDFCRWDGNPSGLALVPGATGYVADTLDDAPDAFDADCDGTADTSGIRAAGVSGSYINDPSNVFITGGNVFPLTIGVPVFGQVTLFPLGYFSSASALCDAEVIVSPFDEERIDGEAAKDEDRVLADGTFDDGGLGGACHTEDQYGIEGWDSPGCGSDGGFPSHAAAEDLVSGGDVWIGASCDQGTDQGAGDGLILCVVNELISGADPEVLEDCVDEFQGGTPVAPSFTCGSDSIADTINYGPGGGSLTPVGVPFVGLTDCSDGSSAVFTYNYVTAGGKPNHPPSGDPAVFPATVGWIDSRNLNDWDDEYGPGLFVPNTECNDGIDNGDPDDPALADEQDPECYTDVPVVGPVYNPFNSES